MIKVPKMHGPPTATWPMNDFVHWDKHPISIEEGGGH